MQEKKCNRCGDTKPVSEFHKDKNRKGGYYCFCKICRKNKPESQKESDRIRSKKYRLNNIEKVSAYYKKYSKTEHFKNNVSIPYNRSERGLIQKIYTHQLKSSKTRGHHPPKYSRSEFESWVKEQPNFKIIYNDWVKSGYERDLRPSVDRLSNYKGYFFGNIQIVTWGRNKELCWQDIISGKYITKLLRQVVQLSLDGKYINEFYSINQAERETGVDAKHIPTVCRGKRDTAGGFKWMYTEEYYAN